MAKVCPLTGDVVLYLECLECDDRRECNDKRACQERTNNRREMERAGGKMGRGED